MNLTDFEWMWEAKFLDRFLALISFKLLICLGSVAFGVERFVLLSR